MGYFPSNYPVVHIARANSGVDPDTGNEVLTTAAPVIRYVQELVVTSSSDVFDGSGQFQNRITQTVKMSVDDPTLYATEDQIVIDPQLNTDGTWVSGTGEAFWIDGVPQDNRKGPWADLFAGFGGVIELRRVT